MCILYVFNPEVLPVKGHGSCSYPPLIKDGEMEELQFASQLGKGVGGLGLWLCCQDSDVFLKPALEDTFPSLFFTDLLL